jgi:hypothetical protein
VDLVEVDVVGLQAAQARFALLDDVAAAVPQIVDAVAHLAVDLCGQDDLVALAVPFQRLARHLFARPTL